MPTSRDLFWAAIVSGRRELPEYINPNNHNASPDLLERYIESRPGKEYQIEFGHASRYGVNYDVRVYVIVDGKKVSAGFLRRGFNSARPVEGARTRDGRSIAPFQFTRLETCESDDEAIAKDEKTIKEIGTIKLAFHECELGQRRESRRRPAGDKTVEANQAVRVHEKMKKISSERTGYGQLKSIRPAKHHSELLHEHPHPFLEFHFTYLSGVLLELRGIKPETVSGQPATSSPHKPSRPLLSPARPLRTLQVKGCATGSNSILVEQKPNLLKRPSDEDTSRESIVVGDESSDESDDDSDKEVELIIEQRDWKKVKREMGTPVKREVDIDLTED